MVVEQVIQTARAGIDFIEREREAQQLPKARISAAACSTDEGRQYWRMLRSGNVQLSWFIRYARAIGYTVILRKEREDGNPGETD